LIVVIASISTSLNVGAGAVVHFSFRRMLGITRVGRRFFLFYDLLRQLGAGFCSSVEGARPRI
jgi:hypothetical protein